MRKVALANKRRLFSLLEILREKYIMDPNSDSVELETVKQPQEDEFIAQEVVQENEGYIT